MIAALVLVLAQTTAAKPTPTPAPFPGPAPAKLSGGFGQKATAPGKARVVVTDQTLAQPSRAGTFSVAGKPIATVPTPSVEQASDAGRVAAAAQRRMDEAVRDAGWVLANTRYNWQIWDAARREWIEAAENCRKTPGCVPTYKPDWAFPTVKR